MLFFLFFCREDDFMCVIRAEFIITKLGYVSSLLRISHNNQKYDLIFRDFRERNVSIKSVDSLPVLWRPKGNRPSRFFLNPTLHITWIITKVRSHFSHYTRTILWKLERLSSKTSANLRLTEYLSKKNVMPLNIVDEHSAVGIEPGYCVGIPEFNSRQEQNIFLYSTASTQVLKHTQSPIKRVPRVLSQG
jgi:hypothetical protein